MRVLYKNNTSERISHPEGGTFEPGQSKTFYYFLKDTQGLTIVKYDGAPWTTLIDDETIDSAPEYLFEMQVFDTIVISNSTGGVLKVIANGDSTHPQAIPNGEIYEMKLAQKVYLLAFDGEGNGTFSVTGLPDNSGDHIPT